VERVQEPLLRRLGLEEPAGQVAKGKVRQAVEDAAGLAVAQRMRHGKGPQERVIPARVVTRAEGATGRGPLGFGVGEELDPACRPEDKGEIDDDP